MTDQVILRWSLEPQLKVMEKPRCVTSAFSKYSLRKGTITAITTKKIIIKIASKASMKKP